MKHFNKGLNRDLNYKRKIQMLLLKKLHFKEKYLPSAK